MRATFDHLAITATDLELGTADVETALGTQLQQGGHHPEMATHNALLSLGPQEYLEVIAIDPEARPPDHPRWFDLDRMAGPARIGAWVLAVDDLDAALRLAPEGAGTPVEVSRGDLRWRMCVPDSGTLPFEGAFPALMQWLSRAHPAPRLQDRGCRLHGLRLGVPDPRKLEKALAPFLQDPRIEIEHSVRTTLRAKIDTPSGRWTLE